MPIAHLSLRVCSLCILSLSPAFFLGSPAYAETPENEPTVIPEITDYNGPFPDTLPVGEVLDYKISWSFIHVANGTIRILPAKSVDGNPAYHIRMETATNGWADAFYRVRDKIDSYMSPDLKRSLYYHKIQEGSDKRNTRIDFDWENGRAQRTDYGKPWKEAIPLQNQVFDPLGITYAFRVMDFEGKDELVLYSTDGKDLVPVDIRIKGRETVKTPLGKFECYLVEPDTKSLSGIFNKAPDASIQIWISAEPPYVPVKLKSELPIGAFESRISGIRGPGAKRFLNSEVRGKYQDP